MPMFNKIWGKQVLSRNITGSKLLQFLWMDIYHQGNVKRVYLLIQQFHY